MSSTEPVNEDTMKRIFAEFKLELLKDLQANYASLTALSSLQGLVSDLASEVGKLKLWRSSQEGRDDEKRNFTGSAIALSALCASILTATGMFLSLHG